MTDTDEKDLAEMQMTLANIYSADCEIRDKIYSRSMLYENAIIVSKKLTERIGFTFEEMEKISQEFEKRGFASKKVRDAAMKMRALFFDDSRDDFRNVQCTCISVSSGLDFKISYNNLTFEFQHAPTGKCFALDCQIYDLLKSFGYDPTSFLATHGECLSGFALVHPYSEYSASRIAHSLDPCELRKKVIEYADRGFEPKKREHSEDEYEYPDESDGLRIEEYDYMKRLKEA